MENRCTTLELAMHSRKLRKTEKRLNVVEIVPEGIGSVEH